VFYTWKDKSLGHITNFFVDEQNQVFFLDAQGKPETWVSANPARGYREELFYLQSIPGPGLKPLIKKESIKPIVKTEDTASPSLYLENSMLIQELMKLLDNKDLTKAEGFLSQHPTLLNSPEFIRDCLPTTPIKELFIKNPKFIAQLSKEAFNTVFTSGDCIGESTLLWLTIALEGRALLSKPELISKIEAYALNAVIAEGTRKGASALFFLAYTPEGRALLSKPELINKIKVEALNAVIAGGPYKGQSALFGLACFPEGRALLSNSELINKIKVEALNAVIAEGTRKRQSALFCLAGTLEGRALLSKTEFINKIEAQALNAVIAEGLNKGQSALFCLADTPEGQALLSKPELINKIEAGALNALIAEGPYKRQSALFFLERTLDGMALLEKLNIITPQSYPLQPNKDLASSFYPGYPTQNISPPPLNPMFIRPPTQTSSSSSFQPHRNSPPLVIPAPQGPNTIWPSSSSNSTVPSSASNPQSISSENANLLQRRIDDKDELIAALKAQLQDKEKVIKLLENQVMELSSKRKKDDEGPNNSVNKKPRI
ncbi:MAG: hypothetical protein JWM09_524, partial [Francisellaceae bacterium]|nr:hypothetical protein [Francisellaceae bacterium]